MPHLLFLYLEFLHNVLLINYCLLGPPTKPKHLQVTYTSLSSLSLRWIAGFDGGFQPKFIIEYRLYQSSTWTKYTVEQTGSDDDPQSLQLSHLNVNSLYEIRMSATNDVGSSSTTDVIVVGM